MGISGLLPLLKSIHRTTHVREYRGKRVAVDAYSWLHKGAYCCARELCEGEPTVAHAEYCMGKVRMLQHHGITPVIVFDGGRLPIKDGENAERNRARAENLARAREHDAQGNAVAAFECYQRAVDVTPAVAASFVEACRREGVPFVVAPYEADAQMAYLAHSGDVAAVITEDSDLVAHGCPAVLLKVCIIARGPSSLPLLLSDIHTDCPDNDSSLTLCSLKMDKFGSCVEVRRADLPSNASADASFAGWTQQMVLEACILAGCDYLPSLPGMGLKKAHALLRACRSATAALRRLRFQGVRVPPEYEADLQKAMWTFRHQRVYDAATGSCVPLSPLDDSADLMAAVAAGTQPPGLEFLGPHLPPEIVRGIAEGRLCPVSHTPIVPHPAPVGRNNTKGGAPAPAPVPAPPPTSRPISSSFVPVAKPAQVPTAPPLTSRFLTAPSRSAQKAFKPPRRLGTQGVEAQTEEGTGMWTAAGADRRRPIGRWSRPGCPTVAAPPSSPTPRSEDSPRSPLAAGRPFAKFMCGGGGAVRQNAVPPYLAGVISRAAWPDVADLGDSDNGGEDGGVGEAAHAATPHATAWDGLVYTRRESGCSSPASPPRAAWPPRLVVDPATNDGHPGEEGPATDLPRFQAGARAALDALARKVPRAGGPVDLDAFAFTGGSFGRAAAAKRARR